MKEIKLIPAEMFINVFGNYVPRLCVDTALIGPEDQVEIAGYSEDFCPYFKYDAKLGIAFKKRDEAPRVGQWGMPGGTIFKGETPFDASKRIIQKEFGVESEPIGIIGNMHFPNEIRTMTVNGKETTFEMDSYSVVVLARAKSENLQPANGNDVEWFAKSPTPPHDIHTPFLIKRGLL